MRNERLVKQVKIKVIHEDDYEKKYEIRVKRKYVRQFEEEILPIIDGAYDVEGVRVWKEGFDKK